MNTLTGLLVIALGSFCQSSSYVPINKVRQWSWENFWLVQGIFAWIVFPLLGAMLSVPSGSSLMEILSSDSLAALKAMAFGSLWGVGGLTFGLSMRYLGVAMGQSLSLGLCAAVGTLLPAIVSKEDLFHGSGLILLIGVCLTIAGIAVIGYAGALRSKQMSDEDRAQAIKDFALTKGLLIAVISGVMSACFSLGLEAGKTLQIEGMKPSSPHCLQLSWSLWAAFSPMPFIVCTRISPTIHLVIMLMSRYLEAMSSSVPLPASYGTANSSVSVSASRFSPTDPWR